MSYSLITGASSGLGKSFSYKLASLGYSLILVARHADILEEIKNDICFKYPDIDVLIFQCNLSDQTEIFELVDFIKKFDLKIIINNAAIGYVGKYSDIDLKNELSLIDLNIKSVQILTKACLNILDGNKSGYILNVSSIGAVLPGPYFSSYYASKSYVFKYTKSLIYELKAEKSKINLSLLCPGPINTDFNKKSGVCINSYKMMHPDYVADYAIEKLLKKSKIIIPDLKSRICFVIVKFIPDCFIEFFVSSFQKRKIDY